MANDRKSHVPQVLPDETSDIAQENGKASDQPAGESKSPELYTMRIDLNALNHLGINLYSNVPAVLSEVVANAYDADAEVVDIRIDTAKRIITIEDDGFGMDREDINEKYLKVGYAKRKAGSIETPKHKRPVMGRKGIGKLALFAVADTIEVHTMKEGSTTPVGFLLKAKAIEEAIKENKEYHPTPVESESIALSKGTRIVLSDLKKQIHSLESDARRRLARRFSILGNEFSFVVKINGAEIGVADRDYFKKIEYLWYLGPDSASYVHECINASETMRVENAVNSALDYSITGWVGAVKEHKSIEEGNNTIAILARGKLVHEDILKDIKEGGLYTKYLIGEIHAEFLDIDNTDDITTSNRQSVKEDDPRFEELRLFVHEKVLKTIQRTRKEWSSKGAENKALTNPVVKEWFDTLTKDRKKSARKLFAKIESIDIDKPDDKRELYRHGIMAFERLALKDNLEILEQIDSRKEFDLLTDIVAEVDEIEAVHYFNIIQGRLEILKKFENLLPSAKERIIQEYIFKHLWLLDPSWERATTNERMEQSVAREFADIVAKLTDDERKGRIDIRFQTAANRHIVIELKKYTVPIDVDTLTKQLRKYRSALRNCLKTKYPSDNHEIELIAILGAAPTPYDDPESVIEGLAAVDARFVTYDDLIVEAQHRYREYLDASKEVQKLVNIVNRV